MWINRIVFLAIAPLLLSSCDGDSADWKRAVEENTIQSYQGFEIAHPGSTHSSEAKERIQSLEYDADIKDLNRHLKHFFNGNVTDNTIKELMGITFVEKDQNPNVGFTMFGTSSLRVSSTITNPGSQKRIKIVFQPKPNQMIEQVMEADFPDEITLVFKNGHAYEYKGKKWSRKE